ncbi:Fc.00g064910.m01.CDS01 [Cosmosporella sp. VM-42]
MSMHAMYRELEEGIRAQFPSLADGHVYLDNASHAQRLGSVIEFMTNYYSHPPIYLGGSYSIDEESNYLNTQAYEAGASYIQANVDEVVCGVSTTQLLTLLSFTLNFKPGDEIVLSSIDHESNINPWHSPNPKLLPEDLETLLSSRTRLVACTHASNVLGTITDIKGINKAAHAVGALVCVDGAAYAPHRQINVKDLHVDFYAFSWHKVYGPRMAMLYASRGAQNQMESNHLLNGKASLKEKLGLPNFDFCQAIPLVTNYLRDKGPLNIIRQEDRLQTTLINFLRIRPDVAIYGEPTSDPNLRVSTISFALKGVDSELLAKAINGIGNYSLRWGSFSSDSLVRDTLGVGPSGVVRVSMVHYNTVEEIEKFCEVLLYILDNKWILRKLADFRMS